MLGIGLALLVPSEAATIEVALGDTVGTLHVPSVMDVGVSFSGGPETAVVEGRWDNVESDTISIVCAATGTPPADDIVEQVMLQVGDKKWALSPGGNVRFTCPAGKKAIVTDRHGTTVGTFPAPVTMTVIKAKSRAER